MLLSIYYNPAPAIPGCECHNCARWINNVNNELRIGTLIDSSNLVGYDELHDIVLMIDDRPVQPLALKRVAVGALLQVMPPQKRLLVNPGDSYVIAWGHDVFTGERKWFISGTEVLFKIAPVKRTQFKLKSLNYRTLSTILNLFDVKTGRKLSCSVTESPWREQIVRLWQASVPRTWSPDVILSLTSPLDCIFDADATKYVQNVPWTVPRRDDRRSRPNHLRSYDRSHTPTLMAPRNVMSHTNPNNILLGLPDELILIIVDWLEPEAQAVMRRVCRHFEQMIRRPVTVTVLEWMDEKKIIDMKIWEYL